MSSRPPMTWPHGGMVLLAIFAFAVTGMVLSMTIVLLFDGGWIIIYLFWPFMLLQAVVGLIFHGGYELVRSLASETPPATKPPPTVANQLPWLREKSGWIGFFLGVSFTAIMELKALWT